MITLYTETIKTPDSIIWSSNPSYNFPKGVFTISGDWIGTCPTPTFTAFWSNNFGGTLISYNASVPSVNIETNTHYQNNVNFNANTIVNIDASTHYNCTYNDQDQCTGGTNVGSLQIVLNNYPETWISNNTLSWATQLSHETDGKHVTFKINDSYITSNVYSEANPPLTTYNIAYSIYVGDQPIEGNYNTPGNYNIFGSGSVTIIYPTTNIVSTIPSTINYL
jgi:hypothetical protein